MSRRILLAILLVGTLVSVGHAQRPCVTCGKVHTSKQAVFAPSYANDGLRLLNERRSSNGLGPLVADPSLMAHALTKAMTAARRGIRGHIGGSLGGANKEGAGFSTSKSFHACYADSSPAGTLCGAAIVQGRNGWHSLLLIRHSGYLPSGATGGAPRRVLRRLRIFR